MYMIHTIINIENIVNKIDSMMITDTIYTRTYIYIYIYMILNVYALLMFRMMESSQSTASMD